MRYSYTVTLLSSALVFIYMLKIYSIGSLLWLPVGIFMTIYILIAFSELGRLNIYKGSSRFINNIINIISLIFTILFIFYSFCGLEILTKIIPINDSSLLLMPRMIVSLLIVGSAIGVFQKLISTSL